MTPQNSYVQSQTISTLIGNREITIKTNDIKITSAGNQLNNMVY
jgi:hypothetical protein